MLNLRPESHACTDVGVVRELNEDRYLSDDEQRLWVVADGMGGMARGDWAAAQVVETMGELAISGTLEEALNQVGGAIEEASELIARKSHETGQQMGSTVVSLLMRDNSFTVLWVGDSRAYLWREGKLHRLTRDHSQVQEMVDGGLLSEEEAKTHKLRNVLTRAVGISDNFRIELVQDRVQPDDVFLLCSDGLYGVVEEDEIAQCLDEMDLDDAGDVLIEKCLERGAPDNVTLVLVAAVESTILRLDEAPGDWL